MESNQIKYPAPDIGWIVEAQDQLSDLQSQTIDVLYQPLVGLVATNLIHYFWHHLTLADSPYHQTSHAKLYRFLQINQRHLYRARLKLEGAGLLKTWVQKSEANYFFIYQLVSPMTPRQFFNDDLLTTALLENVGEDDYQRLNQKLVLPPSQLLKGAQNVSHDFLSVFRINHNDLIHQPAAVEDVKEHSATAHHESKAADQPSEANDFDFPLLYSILNKSYVKISLVKKYQSFILRMNQMYGLDELQMSRLIINATNVNNNVFDPEKLRLLASRRFKALHSNRHENRETPQDSPDTTKRLSSKYQKLIYAAENYRPVEFALQIKQEKDPQAFVDAQEVHAIEELMANSSLSASVVNILLFHVLSDLDHANLNSNVMQRIANEWLQKHHVRTPLDAIKAIQNYNQEVEQRQQHNQNYRSKFKSNVTTKKLPDRMKQKYDPNKNKIDPEKKRRVEAMIRKFSQQSHDKEGK